MSDSFSGKNIENIKLFEKEDEAYKYSRFLKTGSHLNDGEESFQPAIFKVIYLDKINLLNNKKESLIINCRCRSSFYDLNERTSNVEFYEAKRVDVMPLEATFKVHSKVKNMFRHYGTRNYSEFNLGKKVNYINFTSCNIY